MTHKPKPPFQLTDWFFALIQQAIKCFCRGYEAYRVWSGEEPNGFITPERTQ